MRYFVEFISKEIRRSFLSAVNSTLSIANILCIFTSDSVFRLEHDDKIYNLTSSVIVCSFKCTCVPTYIGRMVWCLSLRIVDHISKDSSLKVPTALFSSVILGHLVKTGRKIDPNEAFDNFYRIRGYYWIEIATEKPSASD